MAYERVTELERGQINMDTGIFPMILATEGEASDGHILSIRGGVLPDWIPLQNSHVNDPERTLGSISHMRRDLKATPPRLRAIGKIELTGDGHTAELRRDIAYMMGQGHIRGVSIRWDPIESMPRATLPKGHAAHVSERESDPRKRFGLYFSKWRALEGSVVAVPADQAAVIGRSQATNGKLSEFWSRVAASLERGETDLLAFHLQNFQDVAATCRAFGASDLDLANLLQSEIDPADLIPFEYEGGRLLLPYSLVESLSGDEPEADEKDPDSTRAGPEPAEADVEDVETEEPAELPDPEMPVRSDQPPTTTEPAPRPSKLDPEVFAQAFLVAIERRDEALRADFEAMIHRARGKVT